MSRILKTMTRPFGYARTANTPQADRRWVVTVHPAIGGRRFLEAIQLALPNLPLDRWQEQPARQPEQLPHYFRVTEKFGMALLFADPQDALMEAFKIEEFGIDADILEVDELDEDGKPVLTGAP